MGKDSKIPFKCSGVMETFEPVGRNVESRTEIASMGGRIKTYGAVVCSGRVRCPMFLGGKCQALDHLGISFQRTDQPKGHTSHMPAVCKEL